RNGAVGADVSEDLAVARAPACRRGTGVASPRPEPSAWPSPVPRGTAGLGGTRRPSLENQAIHLDSRLLSRLRRPVGRFNTELLGVLRIEPRPTELHRLATNDAADGSSAEKLVQNIQTNVPPGSTH